MLVDVTMHEEESVAVLTFSCGEDNALSPELVAALELKLTELEKDDSVRALVLTGGGAKAFCTGLDLKWLATKAKEPQCIGAYLKAINEVYLRLTLFSKPTVGALNGHTFAAGLFLAAHLDFRVMRDDRGWACLPEVDINIPLLPGMIAICEAVMPPQSFRQFYYTGARFTATQAQEMGFVDKVCSLDELLPQAVAFAATLGKKQTRTYAEMKRRIRQPIADLLRDEDPKHFAATLSFAM
ncbi:MAG: enoyl-CoA hydratase/isomerase family protein [Deltaproteobacteria bacterium]|nr:enoyl-CoA hydratase/isomerase family protein [Deltaproteobacteria bacterium]